jgi:hypothetical protein
MEKSGRWVADADIAVDYRNMRIDFTNEMRIFSMKFLKSAIEVSFYIASLLCAIPTCLIIILHLWVVDPSFFIYEMCIIFFTSFFGMFALCYALTLLYQSSHWRDFYYRIHCRRPKRTVRIPNPSGCINFALRSSEPLIDLEYNDGVRKALQMVTLKRVKVGRRREMHLDITLEGNPQGELIIKEY